MGADCGTAGAASVCGTVIAVGRLINSLNIMIQETSNSLPEEFPLPPVDRVGNQLIDGDTGTVLTVESCAPGLLDKEQRHLQSIVGKRRKIIEFDVYGFVWLSFTNRDPGPDFCLFASEIARP